MAKSNIPDITVRNAEVRYLNFAGRETRFKEAGNRSFQLMLPTDVAESMDAEGWNVKWTKPYREATDEEIANFEPRPYVEVKVNYKFDTMAPKIVLITDVQDFLTEDTVFLVDEADIIKMDVVINASRWEMPGGKSGITAYLKKAYITIQQDELDEEYKNIPITGVARTAL